MTKEKYIEFKAFDGLTIRLPVKTSYSRWNKKELIQEIKELMDSNKKVKDTQEELAEKANTLVKEIQDLIGITQLNKDIEQIQSWIKNYGGNYE